MTAANARTAANIALASVGVAAAVVVLTTPPLRRLATLGIRWWLGAGVPAYLVKAIHDAWVESARPA